MLVMFYIDPCPGYLPCFGKCHFSECNTRSLLKIEAYSHCSVNPLSCDLP